MIGGPGVRYGTHGTCRSRADLIVGNQNFNAPTKRGYVGAGAYFWEYQDCHELASEFAEMWWNFSYRKGFYDNDEDSSLAIVGVELHQPDEKEFLDITSLNISSNLDKFLKKHKDEIKDKLDAEKATAMFIDLVAAEVGRKIVLVKIIVKTPPLPPGRAKETNVHQVFQAWPVLVVREGGEKLFSNIFPIQ